MRKRTRPFNVLASEELSLSLKTRYAVAEDFRNSVHGPLEIAQSLSFVRAARMRRPAFAPTFAGSLPLTGRASGRTLSM